MRFREEGEEGAGKRGGKAPEMENTDTKATSLLREHKGRPNDYKTRKNREEIKCEVQGGRV